MEPEVYTNLPAGSIVQDIINKYTSNITYDNVGSSATIIDRISFKYIPVFDAIKQLATLANYMFYVDVNKDLHFEAKSSSSSGYTLDNTNTTGTTGLNGEYVSNGIERFTSRYYSSFYRVNAMIGFIVEKMDIHQNTEHINTLLKANNKINTTKRITKSTFIKNFEYHYYSEHIDKDDKKLRIYHIMFDFNKNMPH